MKVLFVVAHPDDEAYGPYGTIVSLVQQGHDVAVYSLCDGRRPTAEHVSKQRCAAFIENCEQAGAKWKIWDNADLSLDLNDTAHLLAKLVELEQPEAVYTHNISDINRDHQTLAQAVLIACRPKPSCSVDSLYFFEVPSSTDWSFNKLQPAFEPNTYVELSQDIVDLKAQALERYATETYKFPDARSVEAMTTLAKYRGYQVGCDYAEAFQLVFSRARKNT
jgi:LmbE family N-acetylglucosaminyl deacetylase